MELEDMLCPAMPHPCWTCGRSEERPISLNEAAGDLAAGDMVPPFFWWTWCFAPSSLSSPCSDSCFAFGGSPSPLGSHAWIATSSLALWRRFCCVLGRPGRAVMLRHSYPAFKRRLVCCFCVASQNGGNLRKEPHLERHLRLVCSFESPLASQAWELLKSTSSSLTLHWVWFVASLQEIEHRVALLLLQGRCPSRFGVATPCPRLPCFAQSLPRWSATSTSRPLTLAASGLCGRAASGLQRGIEPRLRYAAPRAELPGRAVKKVVETTP
ncbi:unnamed protein product [Durusdinium trenchii]|uniref:Uncharacterized protein n=1 Tax=Durusdinium trenchii TaxID=1381693 RepID=A0ABP0SBM1_9DINO